MKNKNFKTLLLLLLFSVFAGILQGIAACSATRPIIVTTVASTGAVLNQLHQEHQRVYTQATDQLRASIRQRGGTIAEYNAALEPLDAEFDHRSELIQTIDAHLYAAAALIDATRGGQVSDYRQAVRPVLEALRRTLESLRDGNALPPVNIPPDIIQVIRALELLAGPYPSTHADVGAQ